MAETDVNATNDGSIVSLSSESYLTARNASSGTVDGSGLIAVGQEFSDPFYYVRRSFLTFAIPGMSALSACVLHLDGWQNLSGTDFDIYVISSTYSNPLADGDFDLIGSVVWNDTWNTASYSADDNAITLNATGKAAILAAQGGTLRIALRSKRDVDSTAPTGNEYVRFTGGGNAYLHLNYTPLITTYAASLTTEVLVTVTKKDAKPASETTVGLLTTGRADVKPAPLTVVGSVYGQLVLQYLASSLTVNALVSAPKAHSLPCAVDVDALVAGVLGNKTPCDIPVTAYPSIAWFLSKAGASILVVADLDVVQKHKKSSTMTVVGLVSGPMGNTVPAPLTVEAIVEATSTNAVWGWLLIPDYLNWQGVWSALTQYVVDDVVLYQEGSTLHVFRSLTNHNTGNFPTDTDHWFRVNIEAWRQ